MHGISNRLGKKVTITFPDQLFHKPEPAKSELRVLHRGKNLHTKDQETIINYSGFVFSIIIRSTYVIKPNIKIKTVLS